MSAASPPVEIYQLRLSLRGINPMIWRRLLVRSDSTLADLHYITQIVMNWSNYYLHRFTIRGRTYAVFRSGHIEGRDAEEYTLQKLNLRLNERFLYEYSFFAWWTHEFRLEKRLPLIEGKVYPVCTGGARVAPEDTWGGAEGFMQRQEHYSTFDMTEAMVDFLSPLLQGELPDEDQMDFFRAEIKNFQYWINVEKLDRPAVNQRLKWYAQGDERWAEALEVL